MTSETMMATTLRAHLHPPRIFCANFSNTDAPQSREVKGHEHTKSGRHFSSRQPTRTADNRRHHRARARRHGSAGVPGPGAQGIRGRVAGCDRERRTTGVTSEALMATTPTTQADRVARSLKRLGFRLTRIGRSFTIIDNAGEPAAGSKTGMSLAEIELWIG